MESTSRRCCLSLDPRSPLIAFFISLFYTITSSTLSLNVDILSHLLRLTIRFPWLHSGGTKKVNASRRIRFLIAIAVSGFVLSCAGAPAAVSKETPLDQIPIGAELTRAQLRDWSAIWDFVNERYADPGFRGVDWAAARKSVALKIEAGPDNDAFTALVDATLAPFRDSHARYLPPELVRREAVLAKQGITGVGMVITRGTGEWIVVVMALPGGPAERAGIASHDRILAIDGSTPLDARGYPDMYRMRGPAGTSVRLLVARPGGEPREITIVRAVVSADAGLVSVRLLPRGETGGRRIACALLPSIEEPGVDRLRAEFARLSADAPLDGFILDLRSNPGGTIEALSSCMGLFRGGVVGSFRNRTGAVFAPPAPGDAVGNSRALPLVVLVHSTTRSAAEMLAGTLQHTGRARLVGARTAGDTGSEFAFALAGGGSISFTGEIYLLPDGSDPGWFGRGITPDIEVPGSGWDEVTEEKDPAVVKAIEVLTRRP
jgi:carboxyl-terminal processing protease